MTMEVLTDCAAITDTTNNNVKQMDCLNMTVKQETARPICVGCNLPIADQYVMKILPDMSWHPDCLKCSECHRYLDDTCTCFFREGRVYCKPDYQRLFLCAKCGVPFVSTDYVMHAKNNKYHTNCFRCTACSRQLVTGDEFALREEGIFCREDNDVLNRNLMNNEQSRLSSPGNNNGHLKADKQRNSNHDTKVKRTKEGKPTRVRTVLSEKQLHTLRTCYGANPRPDALMKEQLVEMTGLNPRVIRVWFQNKRCKDKKKNMLLKHIQQQDKNHPASVQGVPMVAQSPLRHESGLQTIESYHHQSWKRIPEITSSQHEDVTHSSFSSLMGSLYGSDDAAVYLGDDDYMDGIQPSSVSSQFSHTSTSPHSSG